MYKRQDITSYNNYYEFGVDKGEPASNAGKLQTRPWAVSVEGEVGKPRTFDIDELLKLCLLYTSDIPPAWPAAISNRPPGSPGVPDEADAPALRRPPPGSG